MCFLAQLSKCMTISFRVVRFTARAGINFPHWAGFFTIKTRGSFGENGFFKKIKSFLYYLSTYSKR